MARRAPVGLLALAPAADPVHRHHVVGVEGQPDDPVEPRAVEGRDDEPQRAHEMGREIDVDLALEQRLAHEPEIEVLQVAQAAVDELAGARRGAARVVGALDERDRVAARCGVQRDARSGDPAADDEDVEGLRGERGDGVGAGQHVPGRLPWSSAMSEGFVQALWRFPVLGHGRRAAALDAGRRARRGRRPPALRVRAGGAPDRPGPARR